MIHLFKFHNCTELANCSWRASNAHQLVSHQLVLHQPMLHRLVSSEQSFLADNLRCCTFRAIQDEKQAEATAVDNHQAGKNRSLHKFDLSGEQSCSSNSASCAAKGNSAIKTSSGTNWKNAHQLAITNIGLRFGILVNIDSPTQA